MNDYPSHQSKDRSLIKETDNKQLQYIDGILCGKIKTLSKTTKRKKKKKIWYNVYF